MKTSNATKRRRRKERRFRELCDILSSRTALVAALAAFGFLTMQVGRIYLPAGGDTAAGENVNANSSNGRIALGRQ